VRKKAVWKQGLYEYSRTPNSCCATHSRRNHSMQMLIHGEQSLPCPQGPLVSVWMEAMHERGSICQEPKPLASVSGMAPPDPMRGERALFRRSILSGTQEYVERKGGPKRGSAGRNGFYGKGGGPRGPQRRRVTSILKSGCEGTR
jgi:hypothetical protein